MNTKNKNDNELSLDALAALMGKLATKADLDRTARRIIKAATTNRKSEVDLTGPTNKVRRGQVADVRRLLAEAKASGRALSLHAACRQSWVPLKGGYPTWKALYEYCLSNESLFPIAAK